ncbi:MAG: [ribosomal protein S5]-alanine N-acetyltransferase [Actinomycetota bacterium]|nr:[ribosomal protein S5]-alanine N-acetyltransferase [Actinomycetota bacterium]
MRTILGMNAAMEAAPVRVHLQTPEPAHAPEFLAAVSASRPLHRPWVSPPATKAAFRAHVARCGEDNFRSLLIRRNDDEALVGLANLSAIQRGNLQSAYLGFYAFVPYAGLGYMTEGLTLVLRLAFGELSLHRVEANVQPANTASLALVERVGFQREGFSPRYLRIGGVWRDHERWAALADEWPARAAAGRGGE